MRSGYAIPQLFTSPAGVQPGTPALLRLGLPAALTIGFEVGVFNTATALAGKLDPVSLAAHTIALNAAALTYMVPLGIGSAAAVSVGRALGARDRPTLRARAGRRWGSAVATRSSRRALPAVSPANRPRLHARRAGDRFCGQPVLAVAAVFQLFDGLQTVATGALRGAGNTRTPMVWNLLGYWAIGLAAGLLALLWLGLGSRGLVGRACVWR